MIETFKRVLDVTVDRLQFQVSAYLPSFLAAAVIAGAAYLYALLARWLLYKLFKGRAADKFLRQSGIAFLIDPSGRLRATRIVAETVFWGILMTGVLSGLNAIDTEITARMTQAFTILVPKLVVASLILLAGAWPSKYLGRSVLVWAVNEDLPAPRRLSTAVRIVIVFVAVVVAADQLDFARNVFLAAFIILVGGAVLTASLSFGLGGGLQRYVQESRRQQPETEERSLWSHL